MKKMILGSALSLSLVAGGASAQTATGEVRFRYIVDDVPTTAAFYRDKLGFKLAAQAGTSFAALTKGGVVLFLSPTQGPGGASQPMPDGRRPQPGGWTRIVIYVDDLPAEVARLRGQGVRFRNEIVHGLGGDEILLEDPAGNPVELFQTAPAVKR